jgi:hypothetical protein
MTQEVRKMNSSEIKLQHHSWDTIYTLISNRHILNQAQGKGMYFKPQKIIQKIVVTMSVGVKLHQQAAVLQPSRNDRKKNRLI